MKKILIISFIAIAILLTIKTSGQGFVTTVEVRKGSYSKNFKELYSDCPNMLSTFQGKEAKWDECALHVFAYDQACN